MPGLGRIAAPDERDRLHPMRALLPRRVVRPPWRYWPFPWPSLDQGNTGTCVGHGWKHKVMGPPGPTSKPWAEPTAFTIYYECTQVDEWAGNDNGDLQFGTSVRAGAKVLQSRGVITEYTWCWDVDTCLDFLLTKGPVVIGVNFYDGMFGLDPAGFMRVGGGLAGGHCMLLLGANERTRAVRGLNSWGAGWGQNGRFWMTYDDLARLISEDGEACAAVERPRASARRA